VIDDEPNWPKESFIEILQAAFEGKVIDSLVVSARNNET